MQGALRKGATLYLSPFEQVVGVVEARVGVAKGGYKEVCVHHCVCSSLSDVLA